MTSKKVFVIGSGGHGKVIKSLIEKLDLEFGGFFDDSISNKDVIGKIKDSLVYENDGEFICAIGNNDIRKKIAESYILKWATLIHPFANVETKYIAEGTVIMAGAVVGVDSKIGRHCILNTNCSVDHDSIVEDFSHICPGACITGGVTVGEGCFIGPNSTLTSYISVGSRSVVGASSVALKSFPSFSRILGVPGVNRVSRIKICVVTGTRAEYGLLKPILYGTKESNFLELILIVSGTHTSKNFGYTLSDILNDGFDPKLIIPLSCKGTDSSICRDISKITLSFTDFIENNEIDYLMILGDRYELVPFCNVATIFKIPIIHLCGGDVSRGAYDNQIRNSISQLSELHFVTSEDAKSNLMKMGCLEQNIEISGNPGLLEIKNFAASPEIMEKYCLTKKYIVICYHPVTLREEENNIQVLLKVLRESEYFPVFIGTNSDSNYFKIREQVSSSNLGIMIETLPRNDFLSLIAFSEMFVGNSSSGIYEVPILGKRSLILGSRQEGRMIPKLCSKCAYNNEEKIRAFLKGESFEETNFEYLILDSYKIIERKILLHKTEKSKCAKL